MKQLPPAGVVPVNTFEQGTSVSEATWESQEYVQSGGRLYPATHAAAAAASYSVFPEAMFRNVVGTIQGLSYTVDAMHVS
jgi:hypothetical protein